MATGTVLRELYEGESRRAVRFRYGLLLFDLPTIIYLAVTSFVGGGSIARNRDDDRRCQPVYADGAGAVPAQEGAPEFAGRCSPSQRRAEPSDLPCRTGSG